MGTAQKKILFVSNLPLARAGVQAVIMDICRNLKSEYRFDIFLTTERTGAFDDEFMSFGGGIFRTKCPKGRFWSKLDYYLRGVKIYKSTLKILKENGPYEAIHCHNEYEAGLCLAAAKRLGVPVRIAHTHVVHSKTHFINRVFKKIYQWLIEKNATHKLGCSKIACDNFYKYTQNLYALNNPYDSNRFYMDELSDVEMKSPVILQTGSFSDNKNQLFSLDVISIIKNTYPDVKFNMVGFDLGGLNSIINKIKELKLEDNTTIYPSDADIPKLLRRSSCFLFPSKKEGFGIVAIEAQAMGVKCFASDTVPRSTDCGGCEYLPLSAGAKVWAEKIIEDFKATGGKHKKYDCSAFEAKRIAEEYRKIYGN